MNLSEEIVALWMKKAIPTPLGLAAKDMECDRLAKTLDGKNLLQVADDDKFMSSELPFLCLNDESAAYYVGSYMIRIQRFINLDFIDELECDFSLVHFLAFVLSESGERVVAQELNPEQRGVLIRLMNMLLETTELRLKLSDWNNLKTAVVKFQEINRNAGRNSWQLTSEKK